MNRILFEPEEIADGTVTLKPGDLRALHILGVLHGAPGQTLSTGTLGGLLGTSRILSTDPLRLELHHDAPSLPPAFDLILAAPRPKVLKRLWAQLAALGAGRIVITNAFKVEKCYFESQWLDPAGYRPLLVEGLTQAAVSTVLPEILIRPRFKPFLEDELDALFPTDARYLAHPAAASSAGTRPSGRPVIAVGPEGGWTDYELSRFEEKHFIRLSLGPRILRTDTACLVLISRLTLPPAR